MSRIRLKYALNMPNGVVRNSYGDKMCNIGFRYTSDMPNYIVPSVL